MILRWSDGSVVFSTCRVLHFCSFVLDAELHACLEGIELALDICQENFSVETDNIELINMATSVVRDSSAIGHVV
jgi:hypothetical protein